MQIHEDDWVSSDRVDPLHSFTCLLKLSIHPSNPDYDFDRELQAISTHLKSMAKPHGDIDQVVKNILSGSSEIENCNVSQALKDKHLYVSANEVENREWRPGLGRKRARFSMKPDSSQPSVLLEPTFNTKKHKDPEEYFKAYERYENARREIDKQMGTALASDQQNPSSFTRPRRQGLKRESVKTKHLFSTYEIGENHISSQETLEPSIPFNQSSQTKSDKIDQKEEMDLTGYKSDDFMDELLSLPTEDLEGDGAECLLRERLQIKSFQPEDCLPEFLDFTLINQKSSKRTLPKPRSLKPRQGAEESSVDRSQSGMIVQEQDAVEKSNDAPSQSDQSHSASVEEHIRDGLSRNPEISPDRNNETTEEPGVPLKEPTKANSPPSKKPKSKKNSRRQSLTDQGTSLENVANSADKTVEQSYNAPSQSDQSPSASVDQHLRDGLSRNPEISTDWHNEKTEEPGVPLNEPTKANSPPRKEQKSKKNSRRQSLADQGTSWETGVRRSNRFKSRPLEFWRAARLLHDQSPSASVDERLRDGLSRNPEISTDWQNKTTEEPGVPLNEPTKANSPPHKKEKSKKNSRRQSLRDQGTSLENMANSADKTVGQSYNAPSQSDQSPSASVDERLRDGLSRNPEVSTDWHNEITEEPGVPLNEPTKANSPPRKKQKSKKNSRRQSLTDQGTSLENVANSADKTVEESYNAPSQSDQSPSVSVDECLSDGLSRNPEISTDWHNETTEEPGVPLKEPTKANSPPSKKPKSKKNSRRQSLTDQGTSLENVANSADKTVEQSYNAPSQSDQSPSASVDQHLRDGLSRNPEISTDWHNEKTEEPGVPLNEPTKANSPPPKKQKSKKNSRRQSLADQGTSWETGVRRSTRFKTRPLEFWRGERLLYARIHKSLPTVIGMKYTPGDGEGGALEVKSLVDEKYKDLVEFASLH